MGGEREVLPLSEDANPFRPPPAAGADPAAGAADPGAGIVYELTPDEFLRGVRRLRRPARNVFASILAVWIALFVLRHGVGTWTRRDGIAIVATVAMAAVAVGVLRLVQRRATLRIYRDLDLDDPISLAVEPDGLRFESPLSMARVPWDRVSRIEVVADLLLVHRTRGMAHIVPRRAFADERAFAGFVASLRERCRR